MSARELVERLCEPFTLPDGSDGFRRADPTASGPRLRRDCWVPREAGGWWLYRLEDAEWRPVAYTRFRHGVPRRVPASVWARREEIAAEVAAVRDAIGATSDDDIEVILRRRLDGGREDEYAAELLLRLEQATYGLAWPDSVVARSLGVIDGRRREREEARA